MLTHSLSPDDYLSRHGQPAFADPGADSSRPDRVPAAELAGIPRGSQPTRNGYFLCLECGGYYKSLGRHTTVAHALRGDEYLAAHGLPPETGLSKIGTDETEAVGLDPERAAGPETPAGGRAAGVQPEREGRLQCLDCGSWYRFLERHIVSKHGQSPDYYRGRHGLPVTQPLLPSDIVQGEERAARTRQTVPVQPVRDRAERRLAISGDGNETFRDLLPALPPDVRLDSLRIRGRGTAALREHGYETTGDLMDTTVRDLRNLPGVGNGTVGAILRTLNDIP